ncbi:MAG: hypothetical protein AAGD14_18880 [Planctomycetota bacterium]
MERMIALDAREVWDRFSPAHAYAFDIPKCDRPLVAFFDRGPDRRFLQFNETRPRREAGLEMCLMFVQPGQAPTRFRRPFRAWRERSRRDGSELIFPASPSHGGFRPARPREVRWALYVVAAFDKAWRAGDIDPSPRADPECVPIFHLEGPPDDPRYETSSILLKRHGDLEYGGGEERASR